MLRQCLLSCTLAAALAACGPGPMNGTPDGGSSPLACEETHPDVSADKVYADVFELKCFTCHQTGAPGTDFFADDAAGLRAAVGTDSAYPGTVKIVEANKPENSALFLKINGGTPKGHRAPDGTAVGGPMPQGGTITEDEIKLFKDWICSGAS